MRHLKIQRPAVVFLVLPLIFLLFCSAALAAGTLTLDLPESVVPGEEIKISGSYRGDTSNETAVGITVKDPSGSVVYINETRTANDGSFSFGFTLPGNAAGGSWQAQVAGGGAVAAKSFTVNGSSVEISSASVQPGKTVTISGKLKQGNVPVGLTVRDPSGAVRGVDQNNAAADGSYSFDFAVPSDAAPGTWTAEVAGGGEATGITFVVIASGGGQQDGEKPGDSSPGSGGNGGNSPGGGNGGGSAGIPASDPPATPAAGEAEIDAAAGGTLSSADNMVSVTVPADALTSKATLKIAEITDTANLPAGALRFGGKVYEVTLAGGAIKPGAQVKLAFAYDLPGVDEEKINAYYWDGYRWVCLGGRAADGKLEVEVSHFTKFAVMADPGLPALTDVGEHWAYRDIKRLVGMKVASGYPDNTFKPDNSVTRAEFAVILSRAMDWSAGSGAPAFADSGGIPDWAAGYVKVAAEKGVITGYEDNTFRAGQLISRSEICVMLIRAAGGEKSAAPATLSFADAGSIGDWARGYVAKAVDLGIVKGKPGNVFAPADNATRAESAAMIARTLNSLGI